MVKMIKLNVQNVIHNILWLKMELVKNALITVNYVIQMIIKLNALHVFMVML